MTTTPDVIIIDEPTTDLVEELLGARGPQGIPGQKGDKGDKGDTSTISISGTGFLYSTSGVLAARAIAQADLPSLSLGTLAATGLLALALQAAPLSSGFVHVTGGAWDSAARALVQGDLPSLNLATLTATNALPLARVGAPTSTGFPHVTAGAWDPVARAIDLSTSDTQGSLSVARLAPSAPTTSPSVLVYDGTTTGLSELGDAGVSDIDYNGALFVQALSGRTDDHLVHASANGITFDLANAVTIKNAQSVSATGSANSFTIKGSDGATRTGTGANQNGGRLDLASGAAGTGASGTAGNPGAVRILAGATVMAQLAGLSTDTLKVGPSTGVVITPTAITINGVALGSGSAVTWAGDLLGSSNTTQTIVALRGASVPAAGALTTGNGLYVSGASALTYGPLNLAGGANYVTGVLPAANQAAQTLAGDVTGNTGAALVVALRGVAISVTAPTGAGQVLTSTGTAAAGWATPATGAASTWETLGTWLAASTPLYAQADVTTASTTGKLTTIRAQNATGTTSTGGEMRVQSGTGTTSAGAVTVYIGGTQRAQFGAGSTANDTWIQSYSGAVSPSYPTTGIIRMSNWVNNTAVTPIIMTRNVGGTADIPVMAFGAQTLNVGDSSLAYVTYVYGASVTLYNSAGAQWQLSGTSINDFYTNTLSFLRTTNQAMLINCGAPQSDVPATSLTITSGVPNASAATNKASGDLVLSTGAPLAGGATGVVRVLANATEGLRVELSGTSLLGGAGSYGSGSKVAFLANCTAAPTSNPTGGGVLYVEGGALKYRGSAGTPTVLAAA